MKKASDAANYQKYRWFFTSTGKIVIGGKSAAQNESLMKEILKSKHDYIVMHTTQPGSPFTVIIDVEGGGVNEKDIEEQAIFTACFSQEWKKGRKNNTAAVDIFNNKQVVKKHGMKLGTFGVLGKEIRRKVPMKLWLEIQEEKLRAVPNPEKKIISVEPGMKEKKELLVEIQKILKETYDKEFSKEEIMQALPAGGITINNHG